LQEGGSRYRLEESSEDGRRSGRDARKEKRIDHTLQKPFVRKGQIESNADEGRQCLSISPKLQA
jgi:hypothetical protein